MIPTETVAKIEELLKKAEYPAPWVAGIEDRGTDDEDLWDIKDKNGMAVITCDSGVYGPHVIDGELICLLRNSIESLLSERKRHVEALERISRGKNKIRSTGMDTPPISVSRDQLRIWAEEALSDGECE